MGLKNHLLYSYYVLFILIIVHWSQSETPYTLIHGDQGLIKSFNIRGCDKKWCRIVERTNYQIEINLTLPVDVDNPQMNYSIHKNDFTPPHSMIATGYMPIFCGSLANSNCPLKAGSNATYRVQFQVERKSKVSSLLENKHLAYLFINFFPEDYTEKTVANQLPMFSFVIRVDFFSCLLHIACASSGN